MQAIEWATFTVCALLVLVIWQLSSIGAKLKLTIAALASIDEGVFHLAQEQNPSYGACSKCGRRAIVRHVVCKDKSADDEGPELFYCSACYWMASDVVMGDDNKRFKNRATERDQWAARLGPG